MKKNWENQVFQNLEEINIHKLLQKLASRFQLERATLRERWGSKGQGSQAKSIGQRWLELEKKFGAGTIEFHNYISLLDVFYTGSHKAKSQSDLVDLNLRFGREQENLLPKDRKSIRKMLDKLEKTIRKPD